MSSLGKYSVQLPLYNRRFLATHGKTGAPPIEADVLLAFFQARHPGAIYFRPSEVPG